MDSRPRPILVNHHPPATEVDVKAVCTAHGCVIQVERDSLDSHPQATHPPRGKRAVPEGAVEGLGRNRRFQSCSRNSSLDAPGALCQHCQARERELQSPHGLDMPLILELEWCDQREILRATNLLLRCDHGRGARERAGVGPKTDTTGTRIPRCFATHAALCISA